MPIRRSWRRRISLAATFLALTALLLIYLAFDRDIPPDGVDAPAATTSALRVFFTTPTLRYPDEPRQRPVTPLLAEVLADITRARSAIDIAAFDLDLEELATALLNARRRGVTVRVILDAENLDTPAVAKLAGRLEDQRIPVVFDEREAFMHHKFMIVDRRIVWMGSWNMTENDTFRNNNNMVRFQSRRLAEIYRQEFEQMLAGSFGSAKRSGLPRSAARIGESGVVVYFSPEDQALPLILEQIAQARQRIQFMAFSFTSAPIAEELAAAARRGVLVEGVMEKQNTRGTGSVFERLRQEIDLLADGNCYIMHHKVMIIDETIVITGSYNFTGSAEASNDENLAIIHDRTIARLFIEEYRRIRRQAHEPLRCN